ERVVVEADIALAISVLAALCVGGRDPEQRLAIAPADEIGAVVFALEAKEAEHLVVERARAREVADAEYEVIEAGDAGHGLASPRPPAAARAGAAAGGARAAVGFRLGAGAHFIERRFARAAVVRAMRRHFVGERDAHLVERRLVNAACLACFTSPRCAG